VISLKQPALQYRWRGLGFASRPEYCYPIRNSNCKRLLLQLHSTSFATQSWSNHMMPHRLNRLIGRVSLNKPWLIISVHGDWRQHKTYSQSTYSEAKIKHSVDHSSLKISIFYLDDGKSRWHPWRCWGTDYIIKLYLDELLKLNMQSHQRVCKRVF
jgi:hypothetical protein